MWYDKEGKFMPNKTSEEMWAIEQKLRDPAYKIIAQEDVGKYLVSTVWLGLDHQFGEGQPLIFETMVFEKKNGEVNYTDLDCERYHTVAEAEEGHRRMVEKWREKE